MKTRIERSGWPGCYQNGWFVIFPDGGSAWRPTWSLALSLANYTLKKAAR